MTAVSASCKKNKPQNKTNNKTVHNYLKNWIPFVVLL